MAPTTTDPRSPSPAPPLPITQTPGPRASALSTVFAAALAHTVHACSYANFAACFPTSARSAPAVLNNVWRQIVGQVEDKARREFEEILVEKDVVGGLNELERLVGTARARREAGGEAMLPSEP